MKGRSEDLSAILDLERRLSRAWNTHDMGALANLLALDADFVTVGGTWLRGRKEFKSHHVTLHETMFKRSSLRVRSTEVKFISTDIAVAHVRWRIEGDSDPDGTPRKPRTGIFTQVLMKKQGKWKIIASQNTNEAKVTGRALTATLKHRKWR